MALWDALQGGMGRLNAHMGEEGFAGNPLLMAGLRGLGTAHSGRGDWGRSMGEGIESATRANALRNRQGMDAERLGMDQAQFGLEQQKLEQAAAARQQLQQWAASPQGQAQMKSMGLNGLPPSMAMGMIAPIMQARATAKPAQAPDSVRRFQYGQENPAYNAWLERMKRAGATTISMGGNAGAEGQRYSKPSPEVIAKFDLDPRTVIDRKDGSFKIPPESTEVKKENEAKRWVSRAQTAVGQARQAFTDAAQDPLDSGKRARANAAMDALGMAVLRARSPGTEPGEQSMAAFKEQLPGVWSGAARDWSGIGAGAAPAFFDQLDAELKGMVGAPAAGPRQPGAAGAGAPAPTIWDQQGRQGMPRQSVDLLNSLGL